MRKLFQDYLPMPGIAHQVHLRGAINASYAQLVGQGLTQARLSLFDKLLQTWKQRRVDQSFLADLDQIRPEKLTRSAVDRLRGLADFVDPGLDIEELRRAHTQLQAIRSKGVSRIAQEAQGTCETVVREAFGKLQTSLAAFVAATPSRARKLTAEIKRVVQGLEFPAANAEPHSRLRKVLRIIEQVEARRQALPSSTLAHATHHLVAEAQRQHAIAVAALGSELAEAEFRRQARRLVSHLDELVTRIAEKHVA